MSSASAPQSHAHRITVTEPGIRVRVSVDGTLVAESSRARLLQEGTLPPRYYLPREDVRTELLVGTDHATTCPFKGQASYWTLALGDARHENLVWSYERPIPEMADIAGLFCFYNERVELDVDG